MICGAARGVNLAARGDGARDRREVQAGEEDWERIFRGALPRYGPRRVFFDSKSFAVFCGFRRAAVSFWLALLGLFLTRSVGSWLQASTYRAARRWLSSWYVTI